MPSTSWVVLVLAELVEPRGHDVRETRDLHARPIVGPRDLHARPIVAPDGFTGLQVAAFIKFAFFGVGAAASGGFSYQFGFSRRCGGLRCFFPVKLK